jgi:hypothetical protein
MKRVEDDVFVAPYSCTAECAHTLVGRSSSSSSSDNELLHRAKKYTKSTSIH